MPLKRVESVSIRCDACDREYCLCDARDVNIELFDAFKNGWDSLMAEKDGPCVCPQCREEREQVAG